MTEETLKEIEARAKEAVRARFDYPTSSSCDDYDYTIWETWINKQASPDIKALIAALREAWEEIARLREEFGSHLSTMEAINQHMGFQFTQPLMNAREALKGGKA